MAAMEAAVGWMTVTVSEVSDSGGVGRGEGGGEGGGEVLHPSQEGCGGKGSYEGGGQKGGVGVKRQRQSGDSSSHYKEEKDNNEEEEKYGRVSPLPKTLTINLTTTWIQIIVLKVNDISYGTYPGHL